jgi:hypothetical protein
MEDSAQAVSTAHAYRGHHPRPSRPPRRKLKNREGSSNLLALQRAAGGALEHGAVDVEARAVAGAIPAALRSVETQQATEMGASERDGMKGSIVGPEHARLPEAVP